MPRADMNAPSAPTITASATSSSTISVALSVPATDPSGVASYRLEYKRSIDSTWSLDGATLTAGQFPRSVAGLSASTSYDFRASATDVRGNVGAYSAISQATTQSAGGGSLDLSWLPSAGQWASVGLANFSTVAATYPGTGDTFTGGNGFFRIWAGGAFAPNLGTLGSMIYGPNGGHASYDGSDVYRYDIYTRQFSLLRDSYRPTVRPGGNSFGEFPDGSPHPPHDYQGHIVIPVNGVDTLIVPQTYVDLTDGNNRVYRPHALTLTNPGAGWARFAADLTNALHPAAAYDPARRCMWLYGEASGPLTRIYHNGTTFVVTTFSGTYAISQPSAATIDTRRDQWIHYASLGASEAVFVKNLQSPGSAATSTAISGGPGAACMFEYIEEIDRILAWDGGTTIYALNPANIAAGWSTWSTGGSAPPTPTNQTYSKIRWAPKAGCVVGATVTTGTAWANRIAGTTAPVSQIADWQARISGTGVVWHHNFESAAEVNAFRWSPGFGGGNDPNDSAFPNRVRWISTDGFAGGGCLEMNRTAGSDDGCEWWRPFSPLTAPGNGKAANDPAANGTLTVRTWNPTSGGSQTNTHAFGRYGNPAYAGDGNFDGNEYWIQVRVKYDSDRLAANNPGGGKMFYFTLCETSAPAQEIITESRDQTFNAAYLSCYRSVSPPLEGDTPGAGNQPGTAIGVVDSGICSFDNTSGRAANCWQFPLDQWVTLLYHCIPGTDSGSNTTFEIFACHAGEAKYRRIWRQTNVNLPYTSGRPRCHSALIVSQYMNAQNFGTAFTHRFTQLIFSRNWIPPPKI